LRRRHKDNQHGNEQALLHQAIEERKNPQVGREDLAKLKSTRQGVKRINRYPDPISRIDRLTRPPVHDPDRVTTACGKAYGAGGASTRRS